jgi:unsaturated chondroitin disaccharide hydrolase
MKLNTKLIVPVLLLFSISAQAQKVNINKAVEGAATQIDFMLKQIPAAKGTAANLASPRTVENGKLKMVVPRDWTSGFFPGMLWYLYELTNDRKWMAEAKIYTANIENQKFTTTTHDLGFILYCSFGNGYRLTGDTSYRSVIIQSAKTLSKRFSPVTGVIRSWDHHADQWKFPVIIDNMMNLELLFEATKLTGDSSFYKIAVSHANSTLKNHFRKDYSSYHVVDYDPATGAVKAKATAQGYADESSWARGQAWALYGYTMCYRETKEKAYLAQADSIATYIFQYAANLPSDMIPYWDFNDPKIPESPRDASAAAIMASGLFELSQYSANGKKYKQTADQLLNTLSKKYTSKPGTNYGFILEHSTGNKPSNSEIDVPIIYADYYYLEALLRSRQLR